MKVNFRFILSKITAGIAKEAEVASKTTKKTSDTEPVNLNKSVSAVIGKSLVQITNPQLLEKIQRLFKYCETEARRFQIDGKNIKMCVFKNSQQGSNYGFWGKIPKTTELYYFKFTDNDHMLSEKLASDLYKLAGEKSADLKIVSEYEKSFFRGSSLKRDALASRYVPFDGPIDYEDAKAFRRGFGADCWLANWDAAAHGNTVKSGNSIIRLDVGGSLCYRAQGGRKGSVFGEDVKELISFFERKSHSEPFLRDMKREELVESLMRVVRIPDSSVIKLVEEAEGLSNPEFLKDILIARKNYLKKFAAKCRTIPQARGEKIADYIKRIEKEVPKTKYKLPFEKIEMSYEVKGIEHTSLAEHLTVAQKKLYEASFEAYNSSKLQKIKHNANDMLTTDSMLHSTYYDALPKILKGGITIGDLRLRCYSGTGYPTQTPLCADFWDVTERMSIKDYFSRPLKKFARGELRFLPAINSEEGRDVVLVVNKKAVNKTIMKNSFLVDGGETILRKDCNIAGHQYPTHRAVPYGVPANCIDKIILKQEFLDEAFVQKLKNQIKEQGLDIKLYDLEGNLL